MSFQDWWFLLVGLHYGRRSLVIASGPDVSEGIAPSGFAVSGFGAETQLRPGCYL